MPTHRVRESTLAAGVMAMMLQGWSGAAWAQSACAKMQYRAAGDAAKAKAACHAKAASAGAPVDTLCLTAVEEKLARKWAKAAAKGDCPTSADATEAQNIVNGFIASLTGALTPPTVSYCCSNGVTCFAGPIMDASGCLELLQGTMGPPGSVCEGATGNCVTPPGDAGPCCALPSFQVCNAGPSVDLAGCVMAGGLDAPNSICLPSGACQFQLP